MRFIPLDQSVMLQSSSWRWKRPCWHDLRVMWKFFSSERISHSPCRKPACLLLYLKNCRHHSRARWLKLVFPHYRRWEDLSIGRIIHRKNGTDFSNASKFIYLAVWISFEHLCQGFVNVGNHSVMIRRWIFYVTPSDVNEYSNSLSNAPRLLFPKHVYIHHPHLVDKK